MLAKHKVVGSTPITRSIFKPLGNQGLFFCCIIAGRFLSPEIHQRSDGLSCAVAMDCKEIKRQVFEIFGVPDGI